MARVERRPVGSAAREQVYRLLREAIEAADVEPGAQLSENVLAERFGVSRTPVREALIRLRDDRLVQIVPQLGTFVLPISVAAVEDAQFVREALECAAVRLAADRATPHDVARLRDLVAGQRDAGGDPAAFAALDDAFHEALAETGGRQIAWALAQRANAHLNRVRRLSLSGHEYFEEMVTEHAEVVDAVERHDPEAAEAALRHHLRMVLSSLPALLAERPELFATSDPSPFA